VVVATWNVENLFLPGGDAGPRDARAYEAKVAALAEGVRALAPDVLALQEVGDPQAVRDLASAVGGEWHTALSTFPDDRGIRVAFLSRLALGGVRQIRELPPELMPVQVADDATTQVMGRGALHVTVTSGNTRVELVTCHLKSKLLSYPGGRFEPRDEDERARFGAYALNRRAAEAAALRTYANGLLGGHGDERAVVVLGDLNDEPLAATTQILLGPPGSEIGTAGFDAPDQGDGDRLWNLAPLIPAQRRRSRRFRGRDELIDHILVSRRLVRDVRSVDTQAQEPPSITERPAERRDAPGSDHLPVVARFDLA
jgi:endonuclease/exonuclease/phosphatase family metal-dependent hydrolase